MCLEHSESHVSHVLQVWCVSDKLSPWADRTERGPRQIHKCGLSFWCMLKSPKHGRLFWMGKITQWMHCNRGPATTPLRRGWWQEEGVERSGKESKHICHRWWNNLRINPSCQSVAPYCITSNSYLKQNEKLDINPCNVSETEMSESISYRVILHFGVPAKIKGLRLTAVTATCQQGAAGMSCFDFQKLVGQPHLYWVPLLKTSMQQRR